MVYDVATFGRQRDMRVHRAPKFPHPLTVIPYGLRSEPRLLMNYGQLKRSNKSKKDLQLLDRLGNRDMRKSAQDMSVFSNKAKATWDQLFEHTGKTGSLGIPILGDQFFDIPSDYFGGEVAPAPRGKPEEEKKQQVPYRKPKKPRRYVQPVPPKPMLPDAPRRPRRRPRLRV